jgi:hypothetical protein
MTDEALRDLQPRFNKLYARTGRPSIAPEKLLRALLLQALYSVRSERLLMEQLDYNLMFRRFVGLNMDDAIWDVTVFPKNRERLLEGDIAQPSSKLFSIRRGSGVCFRTSTNGLCGRPERGTFWSYFPRTWSDNSATEITARLSSAPLHLKPRFEGEGIIHQG